MKPANPTAFFEDVRAELFRGSMSQSQTDGTNSILAAWADGTDPRWVAYALATAHWETAGTMQPIEEYGKGRGRSYGVPDGPYHQVYYGRGFVQLTWLANYEHADKALHTRGDLKPDESVVETPALAMRPDIASAIMVCGMTNGWFTGRKLADYLHDSTCDFLNARRIINGTDHAAQIAANAVHFFHSLTAE